MDVSISVTADVSENRAGEISRGLSEVATSAVSSVFLLVSVPGSARQSEGCKYARF